MDFIIKSISFAAGLFVTSFATKYYVSTCILPSQTFNTPEFIYDKDGYDILTPQGSEIHLRVKELKDHRVDNSIIEEKVLIVFHPNKGQIGSYYNKLLNFDNFAESTDYTHIVFWDYPNSGFSKTSQWIVDKDLLVSDGVAVAEYIAQKLVNNDFGKIAFYGWSLGGGVATEVAYAIQEKYGDEGVINKITLDRTFTSISEYMNKNLFIPLPLAEFSTWLLNMDFRTEERFNELKAQKKVVYYIQSDERIGESIFNSGNHGEFIEVTELVCHDDSSHLWNSAILEF